MGCTIAVCSREIEKRRLAIMGKSFLSAACSWKTKCLIIFALLGGTAFGQGISIAELNDGPVNFSADNPGPASPTAMATSPGGVSPITVSSIMASPAMASPVMVSPGADQFLPEAPSRHKFWDNENRALFATVAAMSAADFAVTRANLQSGGKELNPLTRVFSGSTAALAANFASETAGVIGLSYLLHKTGHHQLERIMPMLNIGASSFAVAYDLRHR